MGICLRKRKTSLLISTLVSSQLLIVGVLGHAAEAPASDGSRDSINARADYFRLNNQYEPPPGEALHHYTAGFAKILCSAVFVTGLDPVDAAANVGGLFLHSISAFMWSTLALTAYAKKSLPFYSMMW